MGAPGDAPSGDSLQPGEQERSKRFLVLRTLSDSLSLAPDSVGGADAALTRQTPQGTLGRPKAGASALREDTETVLTTQDLRRLSPHLPHH